MSFFSNFPKIEYDIYRNGEVHKFIDYFRLVDVNDLLASSSTSYTYYDILDAERPDVVSQKLYGTPDFYWTFFVVNDHLKDGYHKWPLSQVALAKHIEEKYGKYLYTPLFNIQNTYDSGEVYQSSLFNFPLNKYCAIRNKANGELAFFKGYNEKTYDAIFEPINTVDVWIGGSTLSQGSYTVDVGYPEFINPHNIFTDEYVLAENERAKFINEVGVWFKDNVGYADYILSLTENYEAGLVATATPSNEGIYDYLLLDSTVSPFNIVKRGTDAPNYYKSTDGVEISPFQASRPQSVLSSDTIGYNKLVSSDISGENIVTNREAAEDLNDSLTKIKVIRPSRINEFIKNYKDLINE